MADDEAPEPFVALRVALQGTEPDGPAPPERWRRVAAGAGAALLVAAGVLGWSATRAPVSPPAPDPATGDVAPSDTPARSQESTTTVLASRLWPPAAAEIEGNEVAVDGRRWSIGRHGDVVAVGDWDCDGSATPAVLRPATGGVFVFDRWAAGDQELSASKVTVSPGAVGIEAAGCGRAALRNADGSVRTVETAIR